MGRQTFEVHRLAYEMTACLSKRLTTKIAIHVKVSMRPACAAEANVDSISISMALSELWPTLSIAMALQGCGYPFEALPQKGASSLQICINVDM